MCIAIHWIAGHVTPAKRSVGEVGEMGDVHTHHAFRVPDLPRLVSQYVLSSKQCSGLPVILMF